MFCSNCGHQLPDGSGFCSNCGARLTGQAPTTATVSKTQMSNKEIYYIVLSVISFVLAVVFLGIFVDNLTLVPGSVNPCADLYLFSRKGYSYINNIRYAFLFHLCIVSFFLYLIQCV